MDILQITAESFEREVLLENQLVLVLFSASWCGPCKMQTKELESLLETDVQVKVCKIDVEQEAEIAEQFRVMSVPTIFAIKDAKIRDRIIGLHKKEQLIAMVEAENQNKQEDIENK